MLYIYICYIYYIYIYIYIYLRLYNVHGEISGYTQRSMNTYLIRFTMVLIEY